MSIVIDILIYSAILKNMKNTMKLYIALSQGIPKIGLSAQKYLSARKSALQSGNPFEVTIVRVWEVPNLADAKLIDIGVKYRLRRRAMKSEYFDVRPGYMAQLIQQVADEKGIILKQCKLPGLSPWKKHEVDKDAKKAA